MSERLGANGMPMKVKEESSDEMISEILEVNPNKKSKKADTKVEKDYEWKADEEEKDEEL